MKPRPGRRVIVFVWESDGQSYLPAESCWWVELISWLTSLDNVRTLRPARTAYATHSTCRTRASPVLGYARCSLRSPARGCSRSDPVPATRPPRRTLAGARRYLGGPGRPAGDPRPCHAPSTRIGHLERRPDARRRPEATLPGRLLRRRLPGRHARRGTRQTARAVRAAPRPRARRASGGWGGPARPHRVSLAELRGLADATGLEHERTFKGTLGYFAAFRVS